MIIILKFIAITILFFITTFDILTTFRAQIFYYFKGMGLTKDNCNNLIVTQQSLYLNVTRDCVMVKPVGLDTMKLHECQFEFQIFPPTTTELSNLWLSSDKFLVTMEKLVKQLFSVAGCYRGLLVAMLYIGEEFMPESNDPLSIQAVRYSYSALQRSGQYFLTECWQLSQCPSYCKDYWRELGKLKHS